MTTLKVLDFAWSKPPASAVKTAGYIGVICYVSSDTTGKNLTTAKRDEYLGAGLSVTLVWENTAGAPLRGAAQGAPDGLMAGQQAKAFGWPATRPIYYALDQAVQSSQLPAVLAYLDAAARTSGRPAGLYGPANALDAAHAHGVHWLWQAAATSWSAGRLSPYRLLTQTTVGTGVPNTDHNDVSLGIVDWGQYPAPDGAPLPTGVNMALSDEDIAKIAKAAGLEARNQLLNYPLPGVNGTDSAGDPIPITVQIALSRLYGTWQG